MCDDFFDIGWQEMALIGSLSEALSDEERERRKLEKEMEQDPCCSCGHDDSDDFDPPEDPWP